MVFRLGTTMVKGYPGATCVAIIFLPWAIVYDLKSVGPLEFKLVAPMPEQLETTTMNFYEVSKKPY